MKNSDIIIEFISSANKLKSFENISNGEPDIKDVQNTKNVENNTIKETQSSIYKKHKVDGVTKCSQILDKNIQFKKWKHVLETKKKDDLADCFLQGIWYIQKMNVKI